VSKAPVHARESIEMLLRSQRHAEAAEAAQTVLTSSHEQVRRPINALSIGRWRNYAFAFDGAWGALAESA
jgi:hypothetical protein